MTVIMEYRIKDRAQIMKRLQGLYKQRDTAKRLGYGDMYTLEIDRLERLVRAL